MKTFEVKTYIVQRVTGEVIAVKLNWEAAQRIAKTNAPCRVLFGIADKTPVENVSVYVSDQRLCN